MLDASPSRKAEADEWSEFLGSLGRETRVWEESAEQKENGGRERRERVAAQARR